MKQETSGQKTTLIADHTDVHNIAWGIYVGWDAHLGTAEAYLTHVTVTGSPNLGVTADSQTAGGATLVSVANSTISNNGYGSFAKGPAAKLVVATSTLVRNTATALHQESSATLLSRGDNTIHDNNSGGPQTDGTIGSLTPL